MNYEDLTAKELRELCEKKGIKPSRAKADMIEDLKARDAADELTRLDQEMEQEAAEAAEKPAEEKPVPTVEVPAPKLPEERVWVSDGRLYKAYAKEDKWLDDDEHEENLRDIVEEAVLRGADYFGPPFRVDDPDVNEWIYAINIR